MDAVAGLVLPTGWRISSRLMAAWPIDDDQMLELWPAGRTADQRLRWNYRLSRKGRTIFGGSDIRSGVGARLTTEELISAARTVLSYLTLRPGGTDPCYFDGYTRAQLNWRDSYAEELAVYALEGLCGYCGSDGHMSPGCPNR
ncbi:hypothetical protein [Sphaerisporangium sp. TRM90804]|uniref:hypothetical protein n=1 Tax=Sphaerisporangium sp. TRM90804 TaxID=3031113 RepID=UPI00244BE444|nr:hypothetical protein [Sphaerisporangium sp. TRM90804]MDH2426461.1 hypothetical protein [Sphaerisporangium sp. TRM90804]